MTLGFLFAFPILRTLKRELPPPLPVYFQVPPFELLNEEGETVTLQDFKGRILLVNFMFTSCQSLCPTLAQKVQVIQKRVRGLGRKVAILTFSVDPEYDRPKVLNQFARKWKANPFIWSFLTGDYDAMEKIVTGGFKMAMGEQVPLPQDPTMVAIAHSERIVLVDGKGQIRGFYRVETREELNKLMIDVGLLVNQAFKGGLS